MTRLVLVCALLLVIAACDSGGTEETPTGAGVIVANQGNFGDGNGSVSVFDPGTGQAQAAAIGDIGSIIQSIAIAGGRLYVMSNSGNRIDVFDAATLEQVAQIIDVTSPRYMLVNGGKGYVTSLFASSDSFTGGKVNVIDLATNAKVKEIQVGDNPEGMALVGSRLYVANNGFGNGRTLNVIDTSTEAVVDTIDVECDGPRFLEADNDGDVFVFCTGTTIYDDNFNVIGETDGAVRILDGDTGTIVAQIPVDGRIGTTGPGQDAYHASGLGLMLAIKDESTVLVFSTTQNRLDGQLGPFEGDPIGAVGYDEDLAILYLGRSSGFTTAGQVTIHLGDGTPVGSFAAGISPTFILLTER